MSRESNEHRTPLHETVHEGGPIAETVIDAIAEVTDSSSTEIEPLYESIDPDALEDLFGRHSEKRVPRRVEFIHKGFAVVVERNGRVTIYEDS
ncbi:HalOD1 output domain-containing protein [Haladaptatus sp. T7]|uniref:HalOD1 output domain-containing protein n=1 Tax=Haladaptatus sp. T7 TaxID=2029368 RepID=UPI0021A253A2|nr:HalOD1 output domain-containing protein [Haladaptatus sp. T7]GKZ12334.1 hypothetical protein HAL_02150 [Haladaptatus sp. T7]